MATIPPFSAPTIKWVLTADGDHTFKPIVQQAAAILETFIVNTHISLAEAAKVVFLAAKEIGLDADEIKGIMGPLADVSDATESASEEAIRVLAARIEAYVNPPPGDAVAAVITASEPTPLA